VRSAARISGATRGLMVGYIGPEAALGGPIAFVRDGDRIRIDGDARTLDLLVDEAELAHDLLERQDHAHVIRLAVQPARESRHLTVAAGPSEIGLGVEMRHASRALDRHGSEVLRAGHPVTRPLAQTARPRRSASLTMAPSSRLITGLFAAAHADSGTGMLGVVSTR